MSGIMPTSEMDWTQDLPKIGGYYFILFAYSPEASLEKVSVNGDGQVFTSDPGGTLCSEEDKHWYYGPIPVPAIPTELCRRQKSS